MNLVQQRGKPFEYFEQDEQLNLLSVSQIRKTMFESYSGVPNGVLDAAAQRGTALHRYFFFVLASRLGHCDHPQPLVGLEGYCSAIDRWTSDCHIEPVLLESSSLCRKHGYAGTPDALVLSGPRKILTLVDLKSGSPVVTESIQLLLYKNMEGYEKAKRLICLHIDDSGGYKEIETKHDPRAWAAALCAIGILRWRAAL